MGGFLGLRPAGSLRCFLSRFQKRAELDFFFLAQRFVYEHDVFLVNLFQVHGCLKFLKYAFTEVTAKRLFGY